VNEEKLISWSKTVELLKNHENFTSIINELDFMLPKDVNKFWERKQRGLQGEMAFHIYRKRDYRIAFEVALSYALHSTKICPYTYVLSDACVNPENSVRNNCGGNATIDIKTRARQRSNRWLGLKVYRKRIDRGLKDDVYVAVSELRRKHPTYMILGYARKEEVLDADDGSKYGSFIHFLKLHPINSLQNWVFESRTLEDFY